MATLEFDGERGSWEALAFTRNGEAELHAYGTDPTHALARLVELVCDDTDQLYDELIEATRPRVAANAVDVAKLVEEAITAGVTFGKTGDTDQVKAIRQRIGLPDVRL
jgi:hypothetical protein